MATAVKKGAVKDTPKKVSKSGTALSAKNIARLKAIGVDVATEEEARDKLSLIFKNNGLDEMGNDSITDLIEMAEAFPDTETEEEVEVEDAEAEDVPAAKTKKPGKGKKVVDEEPEEEMEEPEQEEEEPEEEEEEIEEKPKAKKPAKDKKGTKTKMEEADEEADALVEEVEEKELKVPKKRTAPPVSDAKKNKKKSTRVRKLQGKHWEELTTAEKDKAVKPLRKFLPETQYRFDYLQRSVVIKFLGKSNEHNIFKYHLLRLLENGKLEGVLIIHRFKTAEEFQPYLAEDLGGAVLKTGVGCSYVQPFHQDQLVELLTDTDFLKDSVAIATKQDTKMKANREKLEAQLNGKPEKKVDKTKKKPVEVEEEPEEEEEEIEVEVEEEEAPKAKKPAKKAVKAAPVKKALTSKVTPKKPEVVKAPVKKKK